MTAGAATDSTDRETREAVPPGAELTGGLNGWSTTASPDLGIEEMVLLDGPLGIVSKAMDERDTSLLMPSGTALAATWNPDLVTEIGELIGQQGVERGVSAILGPNLNMPRSPLTGRGFEMFSEDPFLTGVLGAAWVEGVQSQGVGSCTKHVVANDTEKERRRMNSSVEPTQLRETYLRPFETAVRLANPWMLMMAYNRVNGIHCSQHAGLIGILKGEWKYDGVIVSDWYGVDDTLAAAAAGLDLEMPGPAAFLGDGFAQAVAAGQVPAERLRDAVNRVTLLAQRTGRRTGHGPAEPARLRNLAEQRELLQRAAAESFVLLENRNGILPLDRKLVRSIAVVGPNAVKPCFQGGTFATVRPEGELVTPLEAIRSAFGPDVEVLYAPGATPPSPLSLTQLGSVTADGTPGVLLEVLLPASAEPEQILHSEIRQASSFVWFGPVPGLGAGAAGRIRITAHVVLDAPARWDLGAGGTGDTSLTVNGISVLEVPPPAPDDVMGVVARAETRQVTADLPAGTTEVVIEMAFQPGRVQAITAVALPEMGSDPLADAVALAERADVVIAIVGDEQSSSRESADRSTAALEPSCDRLVHAVAAVNPATVAVVNASRAVLLPWSGEVSSLLMAWFPGQEFGPALAAVLTGSSAPGGRLPVTFPGRDADIPGWGVELDAELTLDYSAGEPMGYRHFGTTGNAPKYPFGYGLGYTAFELGAARASAVPANPGSQPVEGVTGLFVEATVRNSGASAGRDVVQVYGTAPGDDDARLMGFTGVQLGAGTSTTVRIALDPLGFRRWDASASNWTIPDGEWTLRVARDACSPGIGCKIAL